MESSKETGCQAPEGPILCTNNCGFFGTAATMNMSSKCHKETILKQQHTKLAASTVENFVNSGSGTKGKEPVVTDAIDVCTSSELFSGQSSEVRMKDGPNRCSTCHKRVGLTGFSCKCGNLFCSVHRYSDKHDCRFNYWMAAQDVIAKENPTVKAEKLDKI